MDLAYVNAVTFNGVLYVLGYREGQQHLRRSADRGKTWLRFSDGTVEKAVGPSDAGRAGLVKMETQGRPLVAALPSWPTPTTHVSRDDGETWVSEG